MKAVKWVNVVIISFIFLSCNTETKYENIEVTEKYSLDIPDYMKSIDLQNEEASLQYGNEIKGHFVMIIDETKEALINAGLDFSVEDYADFAVDYLKQSLTDAKVKRMTDEVQNINGLEAISYKIWGVFTEVDEDIFYYMTIYKSDNNYYSMSTWTLGSRENRYTNNMETMINSFKEL